MLSKILNFYGQRLTQVILFTFLALSGIYLTYVFLAQGSDKLTIYKVIYGVVVFIELAYLAFGRKITNVKPSGVRSFFKMSVIIIGIIAVILAFLTAIFAHGWKFV